MFTPPTTPPPPNPSRTWPTASAPPRDRVQDMTPAHRELRAEARGQSLSSIGRQTARSRKKKRPPELPSSNARMHGAGPNVEKTRQQAIKPPPLHTPAIRKIVGARWLLSPRALNPLSTTRPLCPPWGQRATGRGGDKRGATGGAGRRRSTAYHPHPGGSLATPIVVSVFACGFKGGGGPHPGNPFHKRST